MSKYFIWDDILRIINAVYLDYAKDFRELRIVLEISHKLVASLFHHIRNLGDELNYDIQEQKGTYNAVKAIQRSLGGVLGIFRYSDTDDLLELIKELYENLGGWVEEFKYPDVVPPQFPEEDDGEKVL